MNLDEQIRQIPINLIVPNKFQPRINFDDKGINELAESIKEHGIIQPLVLRKNEEKFEIVAGERRFKAAQLAGLTTVPAIISDIDDNKSAEVAIVENIQRRNLTPIEEARAYKNILEKGYLSQSELAKKMGISQSAISNKLRLLYLDDAVQEALLKNQISERHARSLLILNSHEEQRMWLNKIIKERLTVKDTDTMLREYIDSTQSGASVPLVEEMDIKEIQNKAQELPKLSVESANRLKENDMVNKFDPNIVPVELAVNNSKENFFNFLEDEAVNMNMEENTIKNPQINVDIPKVLDEKDVDILDVDDISPSSEDDIKIDFGRDVFDPVSLIDNLDEKHEQEGEKSLKIDLKFAINEIRNLKDNLNSRGFDVTLEEIDLDNVYQFVISIKKD